MITLSNMAAGFKGFNQGADEELARQQLAADRVQKQKSNDQENQIFAMRMDDYNRIKSNREALGATANKATYSEGPDTTGDEPTAAAQSNLAATNGIDASVPMPSAVPKKFTVNGQDYTNQAAAQGAQTAYDSPQAVLARQQLLKTQQGDPEGAMKLGTESNQAQSSQLQLDAQKRTVAKQLRDDGVFNAMPYARSGDTAKMKEEFNANGNTKIVGDIQKTPATREFGGKTIPTFDYEFDVQDPKGDISHRTMNSHDMSINLMPYKDQLELDQNGQIKREAAVAAERKIRMEFDPLGLNSPPPGTGSNGTGVTGQSPGTGSNGTGKTAQAIASGATGPELLKSIPGPLSNQVKALADGRLAFPSGFALKTPYWQSMLTLVGQYDPSFDAINYQKRSQTATAFSKGKQGDAVRAVNQTLSHMGSLSDRIDQLDNFNGIGTLLNAPVNFVERKTGDPRQGNFQQTVQAVSSELRKVFSSGGVGNLQELKQWEDTFDPNASKTQQKEYLVNATKLLQGAMEALDNQYQAGLGPKASIDDLIAPKARAVLNKLTGAGPTPSGTSLANDSAASPSSGTQTGVQPQGSSGPGQKPSAPIAMPTEKGALQLGSTYQTTRGPAVWNGTAFEAQ